jgi:hypothetical protein
MEFTVKFKSINGLGYPVRYYSQRFGLTLLNRLRSETKLNIPLHCVDGVIPDLWCNPTIVVDEDYAVESQRFNETSQIDVEVSFNKLTQFVELKPQIDCNNEGVIAAKYVPFLDKEAVLAWWEKAGFALIIK